MPRQAAVRPGDVPPSGGVTGADAVMLDVALPLDATADAARGRAARAEALARGEEPKPVIFEGR
jgi:hypothetical protein